MHTLGRPLTTATSPLDLPAGTAAIVVRGLRQSYGRTEAVKDVDLCVASGQVFAPAGAQRGRQATTVEVLEGYRSRDGGTVCVLGTDPWRGGSRFRQRIGIVLQERAIDRYLTVTETPPPSPAPTSW